jgi:hypothetical protein
MKNINFIDTTNLVGEDFYPTPAFKNLPDWYKKASSHTNNEKNTGIDSVSGKRSTSSTIKKCMPVFDAITSGYLLLLPTDVKVTNTGNPDAPKWFEWPAMTMVDFHTPLQMQGHPKQENIKQTPPPKWCNPWSIITPKGYSSLFLPPMHRDLPFEIFPGIVDTDIYTEPVELPFSFKDSSWEGIIPAGTPIAQVIPIKREHFKGHYSRHKESELLDRDTIMGSLRATFFNAYKDRFWQKKQYT